MIFSNLDQDLIDITMRKMDHDRDGRVSFTDYLETVRVRNRSRNMYSRSRGRVRNTPVPGPKGTTTP